MKLLLAEDEVDMSEALVVTGRHKYANSRMVRLLNAPASHPQTSF